MRHRTTSAVFAYFNRIRNGKAAPLRADIDPAALKTVLPDVFILEMGRSGSPAFRLAGTRVCAIAGRELRGEEFSGLWLETNRHKMKLASEAVLAGQVPLEVRITTLAEDELGGELEMLLMPLSSRSGLCDRLFGSLVDLERPRLIGEKHRTLRAESLNFIADDALPVDRQAAGGEDAVLSVATLQTSSLQSRITHLRLLDGGRKD